MLVPKALRLTTTWNMPTHPHVHSPRASISTYDTAMSIPITSHNARRQLGDPSYEPRL